MLIQVAQRIPDGRDRTVSALIDYFDQPERNHPYLLTSADWALLEEEYAKCFDSFRYTSRNYFWISPKDSNDMLLSLNEAQELILTAIEEIWATGRASKWIILKARQLGVSTLIEALVAYRTMFFQNINGLVVSSTGQHAEYLFGMLLHIYDRLPWWLKPMIATRKYRDGLTFDNPDEDLRATQPGMHSRIEVQAATDRGGLGEGRTLHAVHISELGSWPEHVARQGIEGDLKEAIAENNPRAFAIIESTAKGAGTYYDEMWTSNVQHAERGTQEWNTMFLPWFFEKSRFIAPPGGWRPDEKEIKLRERIRKEWTQCTNCLKWKESQATFKNWAEETCPFCSAGILKPYSLADGQLRYIFQKRDNASRDPKSLAEFKQELPSTATEAFQSSGYNIFPVAVQEFVDSTVDVPVLQGFLDQRGKFHAAILRRHPITNEVTVSCFQEHCKLDHTYDAKTLKIWELPHPRAEYSIGADVADGLGGDSDYSVAVVNRIGPMGSPDVQVATWRDNTTDPLTFAHVLNSLGRWFRDALLTIEMNFGDTCANAVYHQYQYPNVFRWAHMDSINSRSNKLHWTTTQQTKPRLYQTAVKWLLGQLWVVKSANLAHEMKKFQKEDIRDRSGSAVTGFKDDEIMAAMIALYAAHHLDWNPDIGAVGQQAGEDGGTLDYEMLCTKCGYTWKVSDPNKTKKCPGPDPKTPDGKCGNIMLRGYRTGVALGPSLVAPFDQLAESSVVAAERKEYYAL